MVMVMSIALFSKCFPSTLKRKAGVFKFLRLEGVFEKLRFHDGLVFSNFFGVVRTGCNCINATF